MPMKGVQSSKGRKAPRTFFFVDGIEEASTELHMPGLGGKNGRRGGSERKKKHIPHHIPPQALFPQPPPSSDSTHTPQTHPHLPHLPECSRKGSTQQSQVWSSWNSRCGIFCRQRVKRWPIGYVRSGDLSATVPLFIIVAGGGDSVGQLIYCSQTILRVVPLFFSANFSQIRTFLRFSFHDL